MASILGAAQTFAVLGGSTVTNTGPTAIVGDLGVSPGSAVTGFPPGVVTSGTIHANDARAVAAHSAAAAAYAIIAGETSPPANDLTGQDLRGLTLLPGVYSFDTSAALTGILTLDAGGDPNARFDFQIGSTLITGSGSSVVLINSGQNENVYFQVGTSATLGTNTAFQGNILADQSITITTGASLQGRALAINGAVTLDTNQITAAQADLSATKVVASAQAVAGAPLAYTVTVANAGPSAALEVALADLVPAGTTFLSAVQTAGPTFTLATPAVGGTGAIGGTLASLASGASATFTITVMIAPSLADATVISNTASVSSTTIDPDPENNSQTATISSATSADLAVTKTITSGPPVAGQALSYLITVTNDGPSDAQGVALADLVPVGATFLAIAQTTGPAFALTTPAVGGTGAISGTLGTLLSGASASFVLTVLLPPSLPEGTLVVNTASFSAATTDPDPTNNSQTASAAASALADLAVTKSIASGPLVAGQSLTYLITVANVGPSDALGVALSDLIPSGATFISIAQPTGPAFALTTPAAGSGGAISGTLATLSSGASASFLVTVMLSPSIPAGTQVANTASFSAATTDLDPANNSQTAAAAVSALADLAVTKTIASAQAVAGEALVYTITVTNVGPSDAVGVSLADLAPVGLTFLSVVQTGGPAFTLTTPPVGGAGSISGTLASLAAGVSASFTVTMLLSAAAPDGAVVVNTASVSAATTDLDPANNSQSAAALVATRADVAVVKTIASGQAAAGAPLVYTITVTNVGPSDAATVSLADLVPAGTSFLSVVQTSGPAFGLSSPAVGGTGSIAGIIGTLASGASASFTITVLVSAATPEGTQVVNTATVSAATFDPNLANNTQSVTASVSAVVPPITPTSPVVVAVERFGIHAQPTILVIGFSTPLDAARAQDVANYGITSLGGPGQGGNRRGVVINVTGATYDPIARTVTLRLAQRLNLYSFYQLTVRGTPPGGVTSADGGLLDGQGSGVPGSNYVTTISKSSLAGRSSSPHGRLGSQAVPTRVANTPSFAGRFSTRAASAMNLAGAGQVGSPRMPAYLGRARALRTVSV
ncbi:ice-binding family protein [Paludisphaera soli]|uniref:ice-binding family protein n=1 Tax=Paludisphaera soli TaxID=2712865 RepID=UPI0013EDD0A2|nr:ice-binding family protein [Paludisphaera soli]